MKIAACGKTLAGIIAVGITTSLSAQAPTTASDAPARPAIPFPATPTPKPKEEPMTPEQLDAHLVPSDFIGRTSDVLGIVYSGFRRSQVDPCGCVTNQLGGLDKEARLIARIDELKIPAVQVDAGGFMRDMPDKKAIQQSKYLLKGLGKMGYDAINVGFTDLALSPSELKAAAEEAGVKLISANISDGSGNLSFDPYVIQDVKLADGTAIKVGIIGVTRPRVEVAAGAATPQPGPGAAQTGGNITDAVEAINKYAAELADKADFIVVLNYNRRSNADKFINALADKSMIDVLVMGENTQIQGTVQPMNNIQVVSGGYEGRQLGTLYVELNPEKNVASTWNKHIEVKQTIPPVAEISDVIKEAHAATGQAGAVATTSTATPATPTKLDLGT